MNTTMLLCGMGIGALFSTVVFLTAVFILSKEKNSAKEHFKKTEEMLTERTGVQRQIHATLESIDFSLKVIAQSEER